MARNLARIQQGHFACPLELVDAVAGVIHVPEPAHTYALLDAGCGTGEALDHLGARLRERYPLCRFPLWGVEADRHRAEQADARFQPTGGRCLHGLIEECHPAQPPSLLWFNPPYDQIRGEGRLETELLAEALGYLSADTIMVVVIPSYVLADDDFTAPLLSHCEEPVIVANGIGDEYQRAVVVLRRRQRKQALRTVHCDEAHGLPTSPFHRWGKGRGDGGERHVLPPRTIQNLTRRTLSDDVLWHQVRTSRLSGALLTDAARPERPLEPPPGALRTGHIALLVASGCSDGVVRIGDREAVIRGTMATTTPTIERVPILDAQGRTTGLRTIEQTKYALSVRALRPDGTIEEYSSEEQETVTP